MKLTIIGTGYVGLVTGVCLSDYDHDVTCIDNNVQKVQLLKQGISPIYEPGLEELMIKNFKNGNLKFDVDFRSSVKDSDAVFLALPTPPKSDGSADLSYIFDFVVDLAKEIEKYTVVVVKSTVPVGTCDKIAQYLGSHLDENLFDVVSNPEFLREGAAINDFDQPDRIIIGADSTKAFDLMDDIYRPLNHSLDKVIKMDRRSSELSKYASNCFLATKISFMNEMATICDKLGANIDFIKNGIGTDSRISEKFLNAGIGYGGSCFPKDVKALIQSSRNVSYTPKILVAAEEVNKKQKSLAINILDGHYNGDLHNKTIGIWGGAFKPDTDDIREAPAVSIINRLLLRGCKVRLFDPEAMDNLKEVFHDKVQFCSDKNEVLDGSDVLIITTEWKEFKTDIVSILNKEMKDKVVIDGRNILDQTVRDTFDFNYYGIGRPGQEILKKESKCKYVSNVEALAS